VYIFSALDKIESLKPHAVIAGHKHPTNEDSPRIIQQTSRDFDKITETTTTALELYNNMMKVYPDRVNPGGCDRIAHCAMAWPDEGLLGFDNGMCFTPPL